MDKTSAIAYVVIACVMLLLVAATSVLIARSRDSEWSFLIGAMNQLRLGLVLEAGALLAALLDQNRLLHSVACGRGIAAGPVLLSGLFTLLRSSQAAREPR